MRAYPSVTVADDVAADVAHGKVLPIETLHADGEGPWSVVGPGGDLLAVYERYDDERVKPSVVIAGSQ